MCIDYTAYSLLTPYAPVGQWSGLLVHVFFNFVPYIPNPSRPRRHFGFYGEDRVFMYYFKQ